MVIYESLSTPVAGEYDVIVAGAGPAGVPAAVAAARRGARTLLLEVNSCLGGTWTSGILTWVFDMERNGIGGEIMRRLRARKGFVEASSGGRLNFAYDIESMKLILEQMCDECGVDILLHTRVVGAHVDPESRKITTLITESKSGRQAWNAKDFIDCTGDGDLAARAGCGFDFGSDDAKEIQPLTFMASIVVRDHRELEPYISFYSGVPEHGARYRAFKAYLAELGVDPSYAVPTLFQIRENHLALMINHQYGVVSFDSRQMTEATLAARAEVNRVVDALMGSKGPFGGCYLASTAEHIGVREGRRVHGRYRVTLDDVAAGARFEDAVCRVRFGVDIHATSRNIRASEKQNSSRGIPMQPYDIPIRACIATDVDGLLLAGRCISGDWYAHASYRVTGEAVCLGEAAGTLAAVSADRDLLPHQVQWPDVKPLLPEILEYSVEP